MVCIPALECNRLSAMAPYEMDSYVMAPYGKAPYGMNFVLLVVVSLLGRLGFEVVMRLL